MTTQQIAATIVAIGLFIIAALLLGYLLIKTFKGKSIFRKDKNNDQIKTTHSHSRK